MTTTLPMEVKSLIPLSGPLVPEEVLTKNLLLEHYLDMLNDIGECNVVSAHESLNKLETISGLTNPDLKGAALACLGGVHTFTGNYVKAHSAFFRAIDLVESPSPRSFAYSEISNLLRKLGYQQKALDILENAIKLASNDNLLWRLRTQKGLCYKDTDPDLAEELLQSSVDYYGAKRNQKRLARIKRHMASIHIHLKDFELANRYLDESMDISVEHGLIDHQNEVMNDRGWMFIRQGEYDQARELFDRLILNQLSPYIKSLALQNIGYLEHERHDYREAIRFHSQSLQLTTRYDMRDMAFEDCYKLGLCHEKLDETGLADHFFSTGYRELMHEVDLGVPILGYRKKLLDAYIEFLKENQQVPRVDVKDEIFGFALNRPLKQIRDLFSKSLLTLHLERSKNAPQLCKKLDINTRTYFLYQKKLGLKRGEIKKDRLQENPHFAHYLESLANLTWKEAKEKFEDDLYSYLLAKYQYNKRKLADVLDVSYQQVVQKTR